MHAWVGGGRGRAGAGGQMRRYGAASLIVCWGRHIPSKPVGLAHHHLMTPMTPIPLPPKKTLLID